MEYVYVVYIRLVIGNALMPSNALILAVYKKEANAKKRIINEVGFSNIKKLSEIKEGVSYRLEPNDIITEELFFNKFPIMDSIEGDDKNVKA